MSILNKICPGLIKSKISIFSSSILFLAFEIWKSFTFVTKACFCNMYIFLHGFTMNWEWVSTKFRNKRINIVCISFFFAFTINWQWVSTKLSNKWITYSMTELFLKQQLKRNTWESSCEYFCIQGIKPTENRNYN